MEKITKLTLSESRNAGYVSRDTAEIYDDDVLHFDSFDFGSMVDKMWGHDYEYDIYVDGEWKDSILLLLIKERFDCSAGFRGWAEINSIPYSSACR